MSNQTNKKHPINRGAGKLRALLRSIWLGRRDSNPRMPGPKPGALPLGHALLSKIRKLRINRLILVYFAINSKYKRFAIISVNIS